MQSHESNADEIDENGFDIHLSRREMLRTALIAIGISLVQPSFALDPALNAAVMYQNVWSSIDEERLLNLTIDIDRNDLDKPGWRPPPGARFDPWFWEYVDALSAASRIMHVDWSVISPEPGQELGSQWMNIGSSVKILWIAARLRITQNDPAAAVEYLASAWRAAAHIAADHVMISHGIARSSFEKSSGIIALMIEREMVTPEAAQILLDALQRFNQGDPFEVKASLRGEAKYVAWVEKAAEDGEFERIVDSSDVIANLLDEDYDKDELRMIVENPQELATHTKLYQKMFNDAAMAWTSPRAQQQLESIARRAEAGEYGIFPEGPTLLSLVNFWEADMAARDRFREIRRMLENLR